MSDIIPIIDQPEGVPSRRTKCIHCKTYPDLYYKEIGDKYTRLYLYACKCIVDSDVILRWDPIQADAFQSWLDRRDKMRYIDGEEME